MMTSILTLSAIMAVLIAPGLVAQSLDARRARRDGDAGREV